jgi:hypothetical protein
MKFYYIDSGFGCSPGSFSVLDSGNTWLGEEVFNEQARVLATFLRRHVPGGTLDRLQGELHRQRQEHARQIRDRQHREYLRKQAAKNKMNTLINNPYERMDRDD